MVVDQLAHYAANIPATIAQRSAVKKESKRSVRPQDILLTLVDLRALRLIEQGRGVRPAGPLESACWKYSSMSFPEQDYVLLLRHQFSGMLPVMLAQGPFQLCVLNPSIGAFVEPLSAAQMLAVPHQSAALCIAEGLPLR